MIERFHTQLKAALRAYPDQQRWSEYVPVVLLGCRATIKEDLGYYPAELIYGIPPSLPGQKLNPIDLTVTDPVLYANRLRAYFSKLSPMHPREQTIKSSVLKKTFPNGLTFFWEKTLWKPLSLHLIPVLIAYFHALTNFSPLTLAAKRDCVSWQSEKSLSWHQNTRVTYPPPHTHMHIWTYL